MLVYTVRQRDADTSKVEKALYMEGDAVASQMERLRSICLDALYDSDCLVIDLEKVDDFDASFVFLICSVRRSAQMLHKELRIKGMEAESFICVHKSTMQSAGKRCMFAASAPCYLWNSLDNGVWHRVDEIEEP
jgi:ABC-type transporter Mla MlaB component